MILAVEIDFLPIRLLDLLDIALVGLLIYLLYRVVRHTIALNISIGIASIFFIWWLVRTLNMRLLSGILGQFIEVGVLALLIVFQQEIRRFLLIIGRNAVKARESRNWNALLPWNWKLNTEVVERLDEVVKAARALASQKTGAIIVFSRNADLKAFTTTGIELRSRIRSELLMAIFQKESPLHDGAVILASNMVVAASCILPISQSTKIPNNLGTRHRAAIGLTEQSDALCVVISEETGSISLTMDGKIYSYLTPEELETWLEKELRLKVTPDNVG